MAPMLNEGIGKEYVIIIYETINHISCNYILEWISLEKNKSQKHL